MTKFRQIKHTIGKNGFLSVYFRKDMNAKSIIENIQRKRGRRLYSSD